MQDWSMIPLHIRCTERHKIDSGYPQSDAKWWALQESRRGYGDEPGTFATGTSDRQKELAQFIAERGEVSTTDIRRALGYTGEGAKHVVNGISYSYPLYEYQTATFPRLTIYGFAGYHDDERHATMEDK